jgi:hypothetical protein
LHLLTTHSPERQVTPLKATPGASRQLITDVSILRDGAAFRAADLLDASGRVLARLKVAEHAPSAALNVIRWVNALSHQRRGTISTCPGCMARATREQTYLEREVVRAVNVTGLHAGRAQRGGLLLHDGLLQGPSPGETMGPMMIIVEVGPVLDQNPVCGTADGCHTQIDSIAAVAVHEGIRLCSTFSSKHGETTRWMSHVDSR